MNNALILFVKNVRFRVIVLGLHILMFVQMEFVKEMNVLNSRFVLLVDLFVI